MTKAFNKSQQKAQRRGLRKNMPKAEQVLWSALKNKQLNGSKFRRQYSIENYILDFYCPQAKLAIEVDGPTHFRESAIQKDQKRTLHLKSYNIQIIRFTNNEIYENLEGVIGKIIEVLSSINYPESQ